MEERVKLKGIQRAVARNMEKASQIPRVTTIREVRMDKVRDKREELKSLYPDTRISYLSFAMYGLVKACQKNRCLNARLEDDEIVYNSDINISMAVTVGENLLTPVIRQVQNMDFIQLNEAVAELTEKARQNKLTRDDFVDGTITITNSGSLGGEIFTPMINSPQSAILGIGRIKDKPIVDENKNIVVCPMMYLCLTYDHRIINGSQAVGSLGLIEEFFMNPEL